MFDYQDDVVSDDPRHRRQLREVTADTGLVVEVGADGWVGRVVGCAGDRIQLQDRRGRTRSFALDGVFYVDDEPVTLVLPRAASVPREPVTTRSGSIAVAHEARVARGSRIWVEGIHDAELLELVWGDDLRAEGIVVEPLHGADDLRAAVLAFGPARDRRLGVLLDHLVPGSKESRIADTVDHPEVLVTGHPFVDVWAAVKPEVAGLDRWPDIPKGIPWKEGVCRAVGVDEPSVFWRELLGRVSRYTDLDRSLVGAVERLLDFVTEPLP